MALSLVVSEIFSDK